MKIFKFCKIQPSYERFRVSVRWNHGRSTDNRPHQYVDVRAVLDFQILCFRPETTAFYPRSLPANHENYRKRAWKIQDGEGVDALRSPEPVRLGQ